MFQLFEKYIGAHLPATQWPRFEFDAEKCTHCRTCYKACPTSCIQWDEERRIPYATGLGAIELACISCNTCEAVCPAQCIHVRGEYRVLRGRYKTPAEKSGGMSPPRPLGGHNPGGPFEEIEQDLTETERVIYRRRSIRLFKKKAVPKELIDRIIEAARYAPSAGNNLPWKFVVVTNTDIIGHVDRECARITDFVKKIYLGTGLWRKCIITLMSCLQVNNMDQRPFCALEKVTQLGGSITWGAPVLIHILADKRAIGSPGLDTGIAAQNLVLAAHSLGLGTCYIGIIQSVIKYLPKLKKRLGIESPYKLVTSICVGYPRGDFDNPVWRGPVPVEWID